MQVSARFLVHGRLQALRVTWLGAGHLLSACSQHVGILLKCESKAGPALSHMLCIDLQALLGLLERARVQR